MTKRGRDWNEVAMECWLPWKLEGTRDGSYPGASEGAGSASSLILVGKSSFEFLSPAL